MRHILFLTALLALLGVGACSSSFGGGGDPPPTKVLVVPQGQAVVCPSGAPPPCQ
jgi:hypothetical protein